MTPDTVALALGMVLCPAGVFIAALLLIDFFADRED